MKPTAMRRLPAEDRRDPHDARDMATELNEGLRRRVDVKLATRALVQRLAGLPTEMKREALMDVAAEVELQERPTEDDDREAARVGWPEGWCY